MLLVYLVDGPARSAQVLAEQNDEWTEARRYMGRELLIKTRLHPIESETDGTLLPTEPTTPADVTGC